MVPLPKKILVEKILTLIVTYNGAQWIERCLKQIEDNTVKSDIMIVDNRSTDDTVSIIRSIFPQVQLIESEANVGFGAANNLGMQLAIDSNYSHIFLLNQDAYIQKDCIEKLLNSYKSSNSYGILSPIQLKPNGHELDKVFRNQVKKHYNPSSEDLLRTLSNPTIFGPLAVRFVGAAAWFMSVDVVKKVGFFDPIFYHYGEDNNFAARVQYFGYGIGIEKSTSMIHDRKPRSKEAYLPIKMRSFPLHQLVDIRKPFAVAWMVGLNQLLTTRKKIVKKYGDQYDQEYEKIKRWFFEDLSKARAIRKSFKKGHKDS